MTEDGVPSVNPKLDAMCEMLKTIHDLNERNKVLEKENTSLRDGIALKDEEIGCIETDFNTFKSRAKKIIRKLYSHVFQGMDFMELNDYNVQKAEVERFLKENA